MVLKTSSTIPTQYCLPIPRFQTTPKTCSPHFAVQSYNFPLSHTHTHTHTRTYCLVQSYSAANICRQCWLMVRSQILNDSWDYTNWKQLTYIQLYNETFIVHANTSTSINQLKYMAIHSWFYEVWAHKTSPTPPIVFEVLIQSKEGEWSCICVLGVSILPLRFLD